MNILELKRLIEESGGPIVEVGGPTLKATSSIHLSSRLVITNLTKELEVWNPDDDTFSVHTADEIADIRELPYDDNPIGIVLTSNLPLSRMTV